VTAPATLNPVAEHRLRTPILWGLVFGVLQAAVPLSFWWLDAATVYAMSIVLIAAVYIGFAVADGRPKVVVIEVVVAMGFVVVAAASITASAWLLVLGFAGHGVKDAWQEQSHFVANTRWWPPFCAAVDWLAAAILIVMITAGVGFHN